MAQRHHAEAMGFPNIQVDADWLHPCLHAQGCKDWMQELVSHVPVNTLVPAPDAVSTSPWLPYPTRQWLLRPVPRSLRIAGLALCGSHSAARPAMAMPWDLFHMQMSQLQNIQCLDL